VKEIKARSSQILRNMSPMVSSSRVQEAPAADVKEEKNDEDKNDTDVELKEEPKQESKD
jgi:hypothetical protein